ncbi:LPS assembly lipoprotein LptE [Tritonibacter litoralis]|uniref:LPS assembly lipoprotein LptE n=1 Tax=Tritonibacter litoralis TaxID=2662264 RepID=UPI0031B648D2
MQAPEEIPSNSDVAAFFLVDALEQDLGRGEGGIYALDLSVKQTVEGQAITADNDITRFSVQGTANYTLRRLSDGVVVTSGAVDNFTGYSATGSTVDTLAGERDAEERLMRILADQIVTRLFTTADLGPVGSE